MVSYNVALKEGTQPAIVTVAEAKAHLNITHDYQDTLIQSYIDAAITEAENYTTRSLKKYDVTVKTGRFTNGMHLQYGPVNGDVVITYLDNNKQSQTLEASVYEVMQINGEPQIIYLDESNLPTVYDRANAVTITYSVGYETAPKPFQQFIKLLVGTMYDKREDSVDKLPRFSYSLIRSYKQW